MCVGVLPACKDVEHIHVVLADRGQKDSDPLELEFQTVVSHYVGGRNCIQVLYEQPALLAPKPLFCSILEIGSCYATLAGLELTISSRQTEA